MAPNTITLFSAISFQLPAVLFMLYNPSLSGEYPRIFYLIAAIGLFLGQTLDAIDGKQARRIGASSPIGQLFDHGCDALSGVTINIVAVCTFGLGDMPMVGMLFGVFNYIMVYLANLNEYHTGIMITQVDDFGVTETQLLQILTNLIVFFCPFNPFTITLGQLGLPIFADTPISIFVFFGVAYMIFKSAYLMVKMMLEKTKNPISMIFIDCIPLGVILVACKKNKK